MSRWNKKKPRNLRKPFLGSALFLSLLVSSPLAAGDYWFSEGPQLVRRIPLEPPALVEAQKVVYREDKEGILVSIYMTRSPFLYFVKSREVSCGARKYAYQELPEGGAWLIPGPDGLSFVILAPPSWDLCAFLPPFFAAYEPLQTLSSLAPLPRFPSRVRW